MKSAVTYMWKTSALLIFAAKIFAAGFELVVYTLHRHTYH